MAKIEDPDEIINRVTQIRANNNRYWMNILKLAFEVAPSEARKIMKQIQRNDKEINKWLGKL